MSFTTPGRLRGSSDDGPTQAIRSSSMRMAALLQISEPVQRRPMFVSSRTVIGGHTPVQDDPSYGIAASCAVTCHGSCCHALVVDTPGTRRDESLDQEQAGRRLDAATNLSVQSRYCTTGPLYRPNVDHCPDFTVYFANRDKPAGPGPGPQLARHPAFGSAACHPRRQPACDRVFG